MMRYWFGNGGCPLFRDAGNWGSGFDRGSRFGGWMGHPLVLVGGFLLVLLIITLLVIILVRAGRHRNSNLGQNLPAASSVSTFGYGTPPVLPQASGEALRILNERYAKGEIGDEEYLKKKSEIIKV